ncbi:hypothetical protein AVEN_95610-1 [Araneus ventricosus]|uniref:MADF domain-containing protein n=1 Tax=Araneus ventricosus TaxID=182803 RepID=A0A4Y2G1G9_ARAVE|nr:hypothetical protein AVEN_95610-1 [Araneus ventricosus]
MAKESGEQQMKDLMKLFDKINTEDFILEVERKPAIWDSRIEVYSNKIEKQNSWSDILKNSISEFEGKPVGKQNVLVTIAQKKWKSIRSCYTRELQKKKCIKSGSEATRRKQCEGSITSDTEKPKTKKRKRGRNEDDELIEVLKKKIASEAESAE